jgi:hypothetical protein
MAPVPAITAPYSQTDSDARARRSDGASTFRSNFYVPEI